MPEGYEVGLVGKHWAIYFISTALSSFWFLSEKAIDPLKIRSIDNVQDMTNINRGRKTNLFKEIARQNKKLEKKMTGVGNRTIVHENNDF